MSRASWHSPLAALVLQPTADSDSFLTMPSGVTGLPLLPHVGAFGVLRAHHQHEGVDLYCPEGTRVCAVEAGTVVAVEPFTGPHAGSPWWLDTWAVLVEGPSGVVVYGEVQPLASIEIGRSLLRGEELARVLRVLRMDKGRPLSMLHLELHLAGTRATTAWPRGVPRPSTLLDPTGALLRDCTGALPVKAP